MGIRARLVAIGIALAVFVPPCAATDVKSPQVALDAKIVEVSDLAAREIGLFWRPVDAGRSALLISAPARIDAAAVDRIELEVDRKVLRALDARLLPPLWKFDDRGGALSGPPPPGAERLEVAFDLDSPTRLAVAPRIQLGSSGRIILDIEPELRSLNRAQVITDSNAVVRLPHIVVRGDTVRFRPLDRKFTPGGGAWTIGGVAAGWNGSFEDPIYSLTLPTAPGAAAPLRINYVDPWGIRLVDAEAKETRIEPPRLPPAGKPAVTGVSPAILTGETLAVCGNFPPGSAAELLLNGKPIGAYLVSATPTILDFVLPPAEFPAGPFAIAAGATSGFSIADGARGVILAVTGSIDRNKLLRGESTSLALAINGTTDPIELRLRNTTPAIVSLEGGEDQKVTTSGGSPNRATRTVHAVHPGDFNLLFSLDVGANPCALGPGEADEPPAQDYYDDPQMNQGSDSEEPHFDRDPDDCWERLEKWLERAKGLGLGDPGADALLDEMEKELGAGLESLEHWRKYIHGLKHWPPETGVPPDADKQQEIDNYEEIERCVAELRELVERPFLLPWNEYKLHYVEPPKLPRDEAYKPPRPKTVEKEIPPPKANDCPSLDEYCDELRRRAERLEAEAQVARAEAEVARENQKWNEREAGALDEAVAKHERQLEMLRRQQEEYRKLTQSALDRAEKAEELARENPGKGWEEWAKKAKKDANGYAESGLKLAAEAKAIEQKIAQARELAKKLRAAATDAERAAREAEEAAREARALYERFCGPGRNPCPESAPKTTERPEEEPGAETRVEKPDLPREEVHPPGAVEVVVPKRELERWQQRLQDWWKWSEQIECRDGAVEKKIEELREQMSELEARHDELWQRIEQLQLTQSLLDSPSPAIAKELDAYAELERIAERLEYLHFALAMLPRCEDLAPTPATPEAPGPTTPAKPPAPGAEGPPELPAVGPEPVSRCGPDLTAAFDGALERVTARIQKLPADERNRSFLRYNWPSRWLPDAQGPDHWEWGEMLNWDLTDANLAGCGGVRCWLTVWLWGRCRPSQLVIEFFEEYVDAFVTLPEQNQVESGACRQAGCALAREVQRASERREDGRIPPNELRDLANNALDRISSPEKAWVRECDDCAFCPFTIRELARDWSRQDWILNNYDLLRPDGTVVPLKTH